MENNDFISEHFFFNTHFYTVTYKVQIVVFT